MVYPTSLDTPMRSHSLIKAQQGKEEEKREDPKKCAELIVAGIEKQK
jgi:hypothetical protein